MPYGVPDVGTDWRPDGIVGFVPPAAVGRHHHVGSEVTDLSTATVHTHVESDVTNLVADLAARLFGAVGFTTTTQTNPIAGGSMTVMVFPNDTVAFAIKLTGDTYPRWIFTSDATDGLYMGDGTFDPFAASPATSLNRGSFSARKGLILGGENIVGVTSDLEMVDNTVGPVLTSPDTTRWRVTVNNDGSLSTTAL